MGRALRIGLLSLNEFFSYLTEKSSEILQRTRRDQIHADKRLNTRDTPCPAGRLKRILARLNPRYPVANVKVTPSYMKRGQHAEIYAGNKRTVRAQIQWLECLCPQVIPYATITSISHLAI